MVSYAFLYFSKNSSTEMSDDTIFGIDICYGNVMSTLFSGYFRHSIILPS